MHFDLHVGVDYSGSRAPGSRTPALQVYAAMDNGEPRRIVSPAATDKNFKNWCRHEIAHWLIEQARKNFRFIAGLDHGFSFPLSYFQRYKLDSWQNFLDDFSTHWPTDEARTNVDFLRNSDDGPPDRTGSNTDLRLAETWTSSAKSVFQFDVQGSVAKSTHAGIPWLRQIRHEVGRKIHFWPFDGWEVHPNQSVIAEVFPSVFRRRYPREDRTCDQQDAYSVARWLAESSRQGILSRYFDPPLSATERRRANLEGWILGIL